jgi:hypothetical protein
MARVVATAAVEELCDRDLGEPEGIVEFTVDEQAAVRGDPGAVEFELNPAVESAPQRELSGFTRWYPMIATLRSHQHHDSNSRNGRSRHHPFNSSGKSGLEGSRSGDFGRVAAVGRAAQAG